MKPSTVRTVDAGATGFGRGVVRIPGPVTQRRRAAAVTSKPHTLTNLPLTEDDYEYARLVEQEVRGGATVAGERDSESALDVTPLQVTVPISSASFPCRASAKSPPIPPVDSVEFTEEAPLSSMHTELPLIREQLKAKLPALISPGDAISIIWFSGQDTDHNDR